jgi:hypothetical protein
MPKDIQVIFVSNKDAPRTNNILETTLKDVLEAGICRHIDFYTMDMDDLMFVAKNRVLPAYTILVMCGQKVVCRLVNDIPTKEEFNQLLEKIYGEE